jgi:hypothetical protein
MDNSSIARGLIHSFRPVDAQVYCMDCRFRAESINQILPRADL